MNTKAQRNSNYPWEDTESLLKDLVSRKQETEKIDFKLKIDLEGEDGKSKKELKSELLKDLSSIANSYDSRNENYGFLILGVDKQTKNIVGTEIDEEKLSTHLDDLIDHYLSPHLRFCLETFECSHDDTKKWGAIIILPGIEMPHVFMNDVGNGLHKGEVWVRRGSRKKLAEPEDYSRFFAIRTETLRREIVELEVKMNLQGNDLRKRLENLEKTRSLPKQQQSKKIPKKEVEKPVCTSNNPEVEVKELLDLVKNELPKHSPLENSLLEEVRSGITFLESDEVSWDLRIGENNKEEALDVVQKIQNKFEKYYKAIFELTFFGEKEENNKIVINSIKQLAKYIHKGGVSYDALYVRYLPIVTTLYIVSMASVHTHNQKLIKQIIELDLFNTNRYEKKYSITDSLFFIRSAHNLFDALHPQYPQTRWCDSVGTYLKQYFSSMLAEYNNLQDPEALFYKGEFLLTLTPVIAKSESGLMRSHISSGSYIFYSESRYILEEFLKKDQSFLKDVFGNDLKSVLENFDEYAPKMGSGRGCWADGVPESATKVVFPEEEK